MKITFYENVKKNLVKKIKSSGIYYFDENKKNM